MRFRHHMIVPPQLPLAPLWKKSPKRDARVVDDMIEKIEDAVKAFWSRTTSARNIVVHLHRPSRRKVALEHQLLSPMAAFRAPGLEAVIQTGESAVLAVTRKS